MGFSKLNIYLRYLHSLMKIQVDLKKLLKKLKCTISILSELQILAFYTKITLILKFYSNTTKN